MGDPPLKHPIEIDSHRIQIFHDETGGLQEISAAGVGDGRAHGVGLCRRAPRGLDEGFRLLPEDFADFLGAFGIGAERLGQLVHMPSECVVDLPDLRGGLIRCTRQIL